MIKWVLIGAGVGGALSAGLALREKKELQRRSATAQLALESGGDALTVKLFAGGELLQAEIEADAEAFGRALAESTAREWLAVKYGLTPALMASLRGVIPRMSRRLSL